MWKLLCLFFKNVCSEKKPKDINVKVFNMITSKNEDKTMTKHIKCDCKSKFNSTTCNSDHKLNNKAFQYECKIYHKCKKTYRLNPSTCENSKYLKSIADTSVITCGEIIDAMDVATTNTIATNMSLNCHKKVRYEIDSYILHTVLLVIILLLITTISCYPHGKRK